VLRLKFYNVFKLKKEIITYIHSITLEEKEYNNNKTGGHLLAAWCLARSGSGELRRHGLALGQLGLRLGCCRRDRKENANSHVLSADNSRLEPYQ
jgi:hypothetical protein